MLYLLPAFLSSETPNTHFAPVITEIIEKVDYYFVENEKTARKVVKFFAPNKKQADLKLFILDKYTERNDIKEALEWMEKGVDFAVLSEAGLPCIADPGNVVVAWCHEKNIEVCPIDGPSSIILALISSGFNGQHFTFHGYLPIDKMERRKKILAMEEQVKKTGATQIFMETPYRNTQLLEALISALHSNTQLCIAANIQHPTAQYIKTKTIGQWKNEKPDFHKIPAIFVMGRVGK